VSSALVLSAGVRLAATPERGRSLCLDCRDEAARGRSELDANVQYALMRLKEEVPADQYALAEQVVEAHAQLVELLRDPTMTVERLRKLLGWSCSSTDGDHEADFQGEDVWAAILRRRQGRRKRRAVAMRTRRRAH